MTTELIFNGGHLILLTSENSLERIYLSGLVRKGLKNFHEKFVEHLSCANKIAISEAIWLKARMIKDCNFPPKSCN